VKRIRDALGGSGDGGSGDKKDLKPKGRSGEREELDAMRERRKLVKNRDVPPPPFRPTPLDVSRYVSDAYGSEVTSPVRKAVRDAEAQYQIRGAGEASGAKNFNTVLEGSKRRLGSFGQSVRAKGEISKSQENSRLRTIRSYGSLREEIGSKSIRDVEKAAYRPSTAQPIPRPSFLSSHPSEVLPRTDAPRPNFPRSRPSEGLSISGYRPPQATDSRYPTRPRADSQPSQPSQGPSSRRRPRVTAPSERPRPLTRAETLAWERRLRAQQPGERGSSDEEWGNRSDYGY
jgi:hypothetical protein